MSLIQAVSAAVLRRGTATSEDIAPEFPNNTRLQVQRALVNAVRMGNIRAIRRGSSRGRAMGRLPTTYGPCLPTIQLPLNTGNRPVNSVWELAA